ncbi:MAG: 5'-nucleotidase C-terminal domain-containing protein [Chitinophagaceae bacterium]|nr:5'-nucleotidase C-terminal domain-containing protein [Chitinophagaceae bacterium]
MKSYSYGIEPATKGEQTQMKEFLKPYSTHINGTMNEVVGNVTVSLNKTMPECTLGCFMTDAYLESAQKKFGKQVDMAFMNTGGIRLNSIEPGPITIGKIYELMPFDNLMVLVDLTGSQLQAFLDHISSRGGWPVSGGSYTIENKKATKVEVGGKPIDPEKKYTVAVSDYVANGGDQSNVLKNLPQENIGYLQRDAIIEYVQKHKTIGMPEGTRVTKVND